jgi:localization factor PodJL
MTSNAPWSVKGIDPKAREAAKELARQSGMTLGEWLNHSIRQQGESLREDARASAPAPRGPKLAASGDISEALQRLTDRIEAAEQRSTLAVTGIDQSVRGMLSRLELSEREQVAVGARFEGALQETAQVQAAITARLARLEEQAAGPRSAEALKSLEAALGRVASHLYEGESRTRDTLADLKRDMGALGARVEAAERGAGGLADAVAARVGATLTERLEQAEARTSAAMRSLERSFAQLDLRLNTVEHEVDNGDVGEARQRLEKLAADLTARMEASRAELAAKLGETADGRFDRMERSISEMAAHIQESERRSAQALETMGQEVLRMADTLSRRVQGVEHRSADAIEQVGGEVSRVVGSLETRIGRSESAQAQALEKLGGEIARITERLTERIGSAERRSAQAIDDVGEQVSRVTERLNQRYDRASSDLAERIRQSEERTARLLEEAKDRIDQRLSDGQRKLSEQAAAPRPAPPPAAPPVYPDSGFSDPFAAPPFGQPLSAASMPPPVIYPDAAPFGQTFAPAGFTLAEPEFNAADMDAANNFPAVAEARSEADFVDDHVEPAAVYETVAEPEDDDDAYGAEPLSFAPEPARNLSTRELIEQARAAARNAAQAQDAGRKAKPGKAPKAAKEPKAETGRGGIPFVTRKKKNPARNALLVTGTAASVALMGLGYVMIDRGMKSGAETPMAAAPDGEFAGLETDTTPRAAIALNPTPLDGEAAAPGASATDMANAARMHAEAKRLLKAGDKGGLDMLRRAANLGYPDAQFDLGNYYETGRYGLAKDYAEARRWYERGAANGQSAAMYNLGMAYYEGLGGPKNIVAAAQWFRRAADLGHNDAQYNLAGLYRNGQGVERNAAEAYKWYLIAARGGSAQAQAEARGAADSVKAGLSPAAQTLAERAAASYVAAPANAATANLAGPATVLSLGSAQKALGKLGYYRGAEDGQDSTALRLAIRAFQRDQSIDATGQIDTATASRLTSYAR